MKIDEIIEELEDSKNYPANDPASDEALDGAIDTMHKYQKIEQIVKKEDYDRFNSHNYYGDFLRVQDIRKVLEDGNVD